MLKWLWLTAVVVVLDQLSKYLASHNLEMFQPLNVLPVLNMTLMHNEGAAFSFLSSAGGWQRWFFTVLAVLVSLVIFNWLRKLQDTEKWQAVALALILGGALGNVIDRMLLGHVVDFIDVFYTASASCLPLFVPVSQHGVLQCHWPAFNIADSAITVGVVVLILEGIISSFGQRHRPDGTT